MGLKKSSKQLTDFSEEYCIPRMEYKGIGEQCSWVTQLQSTQHSPWYFLMSGNSVRLALEKDQDRPWRLVLSLQQLDVPYVAATKGRIVVRDLQDRRLALGRLPDFMESTSEFCVELSNTLVENTTYSFSLAP